MENQNLFEGSAEQKSATLMGEDGKDKQTLFVKQRTNTVTTIANGTKIIGNVSCDDDIIVDGIIEGNVKSRRAEIGGEIFGNVDCETIKFFKAKINGNINSACDVVVGESSVVIGDITARNVTIDGNVKGKITTDGALTISKNACHLGDIISGELTVEETATVVGNIKIETASTIDLEIFDNI